MWGKAKKTERQRDVRIFTTMLFFGLMGLIAAFVLTIEKFHLLENPNAQLSCSFNLVLNCTTVMQTWQSQLFGFPNMVLGLMGYAVVVTVAVSGLSGVKFPRPYLIAANICYALGAVFAYWLFFQSVYAIEVLCPWCLIVTFATTILLATLTHYNLRYNTFKLSSGTNKKVQQFLDKGYDKLAYASWLVLMVALVVIKFGDGLFS